MTQWTFASLLVTALLILAGCAGNPSEPEGDLPPEVDRHSAIPGDVSKVTPEQDLFPPILHSDEFHEPVPVPIISTAGGEDAPFITMDGSELYFFFAADIRQDASLQIRDPVNGIWVSRKVGGTWAEPELVWLQDYDELALNGCPWVGTDEMLFCTARSGYTGLHWFRAERTGGTWSNWEVETFTAEYDVGELHIHGDQLFYGSPRAGGQGGQDIWLLTRVGGTWQNPENIDAVNTAVDETRPFVTADGKELWITRWHEGSPAIVRSKKVDGEWLEGELIVSRFAGEPTLDPQGNLYFVHHFYDEGVMLEVDIYVAYRR
jgi:hypothetical protein